MSSTNTPKNNPVLKESLDQKPESTGESLKNLKQLIVDQKLEEAVTKLADIAAKNDNEIPAGTIDEILALLSPKEEQDLKNFLSGHDQKSRLGNLLASLAKEVTGKEPEQQSTSPASRIVAGINKLVGGFTANGKIGEFAKKFGFGGEAGKESSFVQNLFVGFAAKLAEQVIFVAAKNTRIVETALDLRLKSMQETDPIRMKNYADAYKKRVREARNFASFVPPVDPVDALAIMTSPVKKESPGYNKETNTLAIAKDDKKTEPKKEGAPDTEKKVEKATA